MSKPPRRPSLPDFEPKPVHKNTGGRIHFYIKVEDDTTPVVQAQQEVLGTQSVTPGPVSGGSCETHQTFEVSVGSGKGLSVRATEAGQASESTSAHTEEALAKATEDLTLGERAGTRAGPVTSDGADSEVVEQSEVVHQETDMGAMASEASVQGTGESESAAVTERSASVAEEHAPATEENGRVAEEAEEGAEESKEEEKEKEKKTVEELSAAQKSHDMRGAQEAAKKFVEDLWSKGYIVMDKVVAYYHNPYEHKDLKLIPPLDLNLPGPEGYTDLQWWIWVYVQWFAGMMNHYHFQVSQVKVAEKESGRTEAREYRSWLRPFERKKAKGTPKKEDKK